MTLTESRTQDPTPCLAHYALSIANCAFLVEVPDGVLIMEEVNSCLYKALHEAGIEMPPPTQMLHHRADPADRNGLIAVIREVRDKE